MNQWAERLRRVPVVPVLMLAVGLAVTLAAVGIGTGPLNSTVDTAVKLLDDPNNPGRVRGYHLTAPLGLLCVAAACGSIGSLVVGNRMAFFSDAMAHTAMAGVTAALLGMVFLAGVKTTDDAEKYRWTIPLVMAGIGSAIGLVIAVIQDLTALSSDTVIGVFFALALGFAGLMLPALQQKLSVPLEEILFGQLLMLRDEKLLMVIAMAVATLAIVAVGYNQFLLGSFNPSLANSRGLPVRWNNYLFVVLLAVVVNLSVYAVGVLLINALLVVPAAAAANVSGNVRRMFWVTFLGSIGCALLGYQMSASTQIALGNLTLTPGPSGAVVLVCVGWFFFSLVVRAIRKRFFGTPHAHDPATCSHDHEHGQYHSH